MKSKVIVYDLSGRQFIWNQRWTSNELTITMSSEQVLVVKVLQNPKYSNQEDYLLEVD
jgi:hypothetical protein